MPDPRRAKCEQICTKDEKKQWAIGTFENPPENHIKTVWNAKDSPCVAFVYGAGQFNTVVISASEFLAKLVGNVKRISINLKDL